MIGIHALVFTLYITVLLLSAPEQGAGATHGRIVNDLTSSPIHDAIVTIDGEVVRTNDDGLFPLKENWVSLAARAPGYLRAEERSSTPGDFGPLKALEIRLAPFTPKAIYLSGYGIASTVLRTPALALIAETEINAW